LGDEIEVKILRVDTESRKIGLSLRRVQWAAEEQASDSAQKRAETGAETVLSDAAVGQTAEEQEAGDETAQTGNNDEAENKADN
jgi:ribosomal protein S1